jgi:hypothetical protein
MVHTLSSSSREVDSHQNILQQMWLWGSLGTSTRRMLGTERCVIEEQWILCIVFYMMQNTALWLFPLILWLFSYNLRMYYTTTVLYVLSSLVVLFVAVTEIFVCEFSWVSNFFYLCHSKVCLFLLQAVFICVNGCCYVLWAFWLFLALYWVRDSKRCRVV